jgi:hypothetical protein
VLRSHLLDLADLLDLEHHWHLLVPVDLPDLPDLLDQLDPEPQPDQVILELLVDLAGLVDLLDRQHLVHLRHPVDLQVLLLRQHRLFRLDLEDQ